jgi:hypothetical protein
MKINWGSRLILERMILNQNQTFIFSIVGMGCNMGKVWRPKGRGGGLTLQKNEKLERDRRRFG